MVISLGKISLKTAPKEDRKDISMMHSLQFTNEDIMKEVMDQAYDKYQLDIANIQVALTVSKKLIFLYSQCYSFRFYWPNRQMIGKKFSIMGESLRCTFWNQLL